jgi:hypothetical protein
MSHKLSPFSLMVVFAVLANRAFACSPPLRTVFDISFHRIDFRCYDVIVIQTFSLGKGRSGGFSILAVECERF